MRVSAVLLARSIAFFDINELSPRGAVYAPGIITLLAARFAFRTLPTSLNEEDENGKKQENGASFRGGYFEGQTISELTLYNDGIKIDLLSSTTDAKRILIETLNWLVDEAGITFSPSMIKRWGFLSNLVFESDIDLDLLNPALRTVGAGISELVNARNNTKIAFRPASIKWDFERVTLDMPLAPFTIERRSKVEFSENKYYSSAPLETEDHISLLQGFEVNFRLLQK